MAKNGFTADQIIDAITRAHGNLSAAARVLGCSRQTVYNYMDRYATVKAAYEDQRETLIDFAENKLFEQVKAGNVTAIIFTLKTIGKHRGYVERSEVTGADGGPLTLTQLEIINPDVSS